MEPKKGERTGKASIVFAHGLWADGSCYSKVIPTLQAEGHEVISAQNSLDSLEGDVAAVIRALGRVSSPAILVGHSYAGTIITAAGTIGCFAGDLSEAEQKLVWATQGVPAADLFNQKLEGTAWKSKPSWYIVAKNDRTVHPELQRSAAKRMGATVYEVASSHVPMLSNPSLVLDVIRSAAKAVQGATAAA